MIFFYPITLFVGENVKFNQFQKCCLMYQQTYCEVKSKSVFYLSLCFSLFWDILTWHFTFLLFTNYNTVFCSFQKTLFRDGVEGEGDKSSVVHSFLIVTEYNRLITRDFSSWRASPSSVEYCFTRKLCKIYFQ